MPDWILLPPILFPLFGTLALMPISSRSAISVRQWIAIGFLIIELALILLNIAPGSHHLMISNWGIASFTISLQMDGITQLLLLAMFIPLTALWLVAPPRQPFDFYTASVLTTAILLTAADGIVTALIAWTLLDLALFIWRLVRNIERVTALRSLAIGLFAGMIFLAGAILLTPHPTEGAMLIAFALWARLGLFPFHPLLPTRGADEFDLWFARGIPTIAAANLWLHWSAFRAPVPYTLIGVLTSITLIVAAIWIWRAADATDKIRIGAMYACALMPLSLASGGDAGVALALWQTLAIAFALALCEIAQRWRAENRNYYPRLVWTLGLLALAGLPLTPAFLGRIAFYVAMAENGEWLFLLLACVTTLIIFTPLWNLVRALQGSEPREPTRVEYAGVTLAWLAFAVPAFMPMIIAPALAPSVGEAADRALDRVLRTNDALGVATGAIVLVLPVLVAFFLYPFVKEYRSPPHAFVSRLARVSDLDWVERGLSRLGFQIGITARNAFTIAEVNPTVWILLVSLWVAIFISIAR
jgi:hypothetical protein